MLVNGKDYPIYYGKLKKIETTNQCFRWANSWQKPSKTIKKQPSKLLKIELAGEENRN
jgi:hypothetical protein